MIRILAMRIEKYVGQTVSGHNCDFEYTDEVKTRHVLLGLDEKNNKVAITLWDEEGECGSGWTTASWGHISIEYIDRFEGYTHKAKGVIEIPGISADKYNDYDDIHNDVFEVTYDGGDSYYPSGYYNVKEELFIETDRYCDERTVWVFKGESALGKSYIAGKLEGLTVYETDSAPYLPDEIVQDVVVLGNKYDFNIDEVRGSLLGTPQVVIVDFIDGSY